MAEWGFYGRRAELAEIDKILARGRFFFCAISGRRRIGKTSLIQEAIRRRSGGTAQAVYVQIPDSDERGVIQAFEDAVEDIGFDQSIAREACKNFQEIAMVLAAFWRRGWITALDEFQYFNRKALFEFQSHLQRAVDWARSDASIRGGLFTLGSIHTEMTAILEDQASPLFNRVTDRLGVKAYPVDSGRSFPPVPAFRPA